MLISQIKNYIYGILHINPKVVDTSFQKIPEKWGCFTKKCQLVNEGCHIYHRRARRTIFGYGEDALTYWAITSQLDKILEVLEANQDRSIPFNTIIIYRPSFGRGGKSKAIFGEFDAIIGTKKAVYLIESKWDRSSESKKGNINLRPVQTLRHEIMQWYFKKWWVTRPKNWNDFVTRHQLSFKTNFSGKEIAPDGSHLAHNLEFVLNKLDSCGKQVVNVLLLFMKKVNNKQKPSIVNPSSFVLVTLDYQPIAHSGYFQM